MNVSILITTLNAASALPECLEALQEFNDVIVIDSHSTDNTKEICEFYKAQYVAYKWNGQYPKKRQWVLENVETKHDYIFFVDADEIITSDLIKEIKNCRFSAAGYFVKGQYEINDKILKYGLQNNKLALFDKNKFEFPVIDDLNTPHMGEIEGHYQPVLKLENSGETIDHLESCLIHKAYNDNWDERHNRYAQWEADMILNDKYPKEVSQKRAWLKQIFRRAPCRPLIAFIHCYVLKFGFLDGQAGYNFALSRLKYYQKVSNALKANKA